MNVESYIWFINLDFISLKYIYHFFPIHFQMCSLLKTGDWTVERDEDLTAPYAFSKTTWLAFEDEVSINIKAKYILLRELAGGAVFPIDSDTDSENCAHQPGGRIASALQYNFANLARKPRQVVLESLQEQIHDTAFFSQEGITPQTSFLQTLNF